MQRAKAEGIEVVFGGGPNEELGGLYYRPTLFREPPRDAEIVQHEVFGPVLTLQRFSGEDEGIALANDTTYGLSAIVYTGDRDRAERVSAALVAGHRVGELLLRARPPRAVRRVAEQRDRTRGRLLELRLLRGREERRHGTLELTKT